LDQKDVWEIKKQLRRDQTTFCCMKTVIFDKYVFCWPTSCPASPQAWQPRQPASRPASQPASQPASKQASKHVSKQASTQARKHASKQARKQSSKQASQQARKQASTQASKYEIRGGADVEWVKTIMKSQGP
jgi:hypothetical protein